jgi:hypothetical protein
LVSVFRVNLKGRDSDTEPPGQRAERALDLLEHGLGEYAVSPGPPPAPQKQKCRICAHHGRTVTRQSAAPNGYRVSHDRGAVTAGNEAAVWPSLTPGSATTTSSATSRSDQRDHARLRLVTRFLPAFFITGTSTAIRGAAFTLRLFS